MKINIMYISTMTTTFNIIKQKFLTSAVLIRNYAVAPLATPKKKKTSKLGPMIEKRLLPVETDANKLVNYVCGSNLLKTGSDIKLKPDSEYPDWLWTLNVDRIIPLDELDPNTKQYHRRLRRMSLRRNNQLLKLRKF